MSKEEKNMIVPKLRFPEFMKSKDWEKKSLAEIGEFKNGINFSPSQKGSGMLTADVLNMYDWGIQMKLEDLYRVEVAAKEYVLVDEDILFVRSSLKREGVGWASLFKAIHEPVTFCGFLIRLRLNSPEVTNPTFLLHYLRSNFGRNRIIAVSGTGTITNISQDSLKNISFYFPEKSEQQKIASCLSSLDDLVTAHTQKLEALKAHKKGLMQQLFPGQGENIPELRFEEFKNSEEWTEKILKDVCKMQAGKFVSASEIKANNIDDLYPCYGGNGLRGYVSSYTHEGTYSLIGRQGALCGNVTLANGKFHATEHAVVVTPKENADTRWLFFMLNHLNLNQYATGQAQPGLSVENLEKVVLKIPTSKKEQQKIASFLFSLDNLITVQAEKVEQLKLHKKGLMQGLFPTINE